VFASGVTYTAVTRVRRAADMLFRPYPNFIRYQLALNSHGISIGKVNIMSNYIVNSIPNGIANIIVNYIVNAIANVKAKTIAKNIDNSIDNSMPNLSSP
jgi:hypothetical protein